nr:protein 91 [synthetic construct]
MRGAIAIWAEVGFGGHSCLLSPKAHLPANKMNRILLNAVVDPHATAAATDTNGTEAAASHGECVPNSHEYGHQWEQDFAMGCLWFCFALSIGILLFYAFENWRATCGWEEVYVCVIELIMVSLEIFKGHSAPATIYQTNGTRALWLRYAEWLLTCPVILIHLSNITGMHEEYTKRTMTLLVTDIGTIVFGTTAALTKGGLKVLFFFIGLTYGCVTFFNAAKVYQESFYMVPAGMCRDLVKYMCWIYFISWPMFPVLFVAGPEGFHVISWSGSIIGHTVADILSKNLWGLIGHYLRYKIHEYILIHGDIRKKVHHNILGQDEEIEEFVDEEDDQTTKMSSQG